MIGLLAWIPLLHPINALQPWWYLLLVPLALGISIIYKAMRVTDLRRYWRQVVMMTVQIVLAMIALAVALTILVQVLIPLVPVGRGV